MLLMANNIKMRRLQKIDDENIIFNKKEKNL